jgi:hypothetical protein
LRGSWDLHIVLDAREMEERQMIRTRIPASGSKEEMKRTISSGGREIASNNRDLDVSAGRPCLKCIPSLPAEPEAMQS